VSPSASVLPGQVTIDDGQPQTAFEADSGTTFGTSPSLEGTTSDGSTGVLTGLEPGPTFDGHVDVNDQPSDY
jgi:hypothetical protein